MDLDRKKYRELSLSKDFRTINRLSETRESLAYVSKITPSEKVIVISSKYRFTEGDNQELPCFERLEFLAESLSCTKEESPDEDRNILRFGIDTSGYVYCIYPHFDSQPLKLAKSKIQDFLPTFIRCVQVVERFHTKNIFFGDLVDSSFRMLPKDRISMPFILGSYSTISASVPKEFNDYISPEQRISGEASILSDVYALGVLGYHLSCGVEYQTDEGLKCTPFLKIKEPPSKVNTEIPGWFDDVIASALAIDPEKRIKNASELLKYLEEGVREDKVSLPKVEWLSSALVKYQNGALITSNAQRGDLIRRDHRGEIVGKGRQGNYREDPRGQSKKGSGKKEKQSTSRSLLALIWGSTLTLTLMVAVIILYSLGIVGFSGDSLSKELKRVYEEASEDVVKRNILIFADETEVIDKRKEALKSLIGIKISWDKTIIRELSKSKFGYLVLADIYPLLEKYAEKFGYERLLKEIISLVKGIEASRGAAAVYAAIADSLVAMDPSEFSDARTSAVRTLFQLDSDVAFRLAALLGVESAPDVFFPLVRDFIITKNFPNVPKKISSTFLFVLAPNLRDLLDAPLDQVFTDMEDDDLRSLANIYLDNSSNGFDETFNIILMEYLSRKPASSFTEYFLSLATTNEIRQIPVRVAFYKLALESASIEDLNVFREWGDTRWEEVLYSIIIISHDANIHSKVLDIIHHRGPKNPRSIVLMKWLKDKLWSNRAKYAYSLSIFALKEQSSSEEIESAFEALMPVSQHGLFEALIEINEEYFTIEAVRRIGPIMTSDTIAPLLKHPLKEVRLAGVRAMAGKNDISTLQHIVRAYRQEKDADVKALYNKIHWVTLDQELPDSLKTNQSGL